MKLLLAMTGLLRGSGGLSLLRRSQGPARWRIFRLCYVDGKEARIDFLRCFNAAVAVRLQEEIGQESS